MSREFTTAIKGIAIIIVFTIHCLGQLGVQHIQFIAAVGVSMFLICSGYGIESSYRVNGIKWYWIKRVLTVLVPYWLVQIVAIIVFNGTKEALVRQVLLIDSNWYVPYILGCYLLFWLVSLVVRNEKKWLFLLLVFLLWLVVDSLFFAEEMSPVLRSRQMLCFPFGVWLKDNEGKLLEFDSKVKQVIIGCGISIFSLVVMFASQTGVIEGLPYLVQGIMSLITVCPIAIGLLMISASIQQIIINPVFIFFGVISYSLFLTHWQAIDRLYMHWYGVKQFISFTVLGTLALVLVDKLLINRLKKKLH